MDIAKNRYIIELKKSIKDLRRSNDIEKTQYYRGLCEGIMLILLKMNIVDKNELHEMVEHTELEIPNIYHIDANNMNSFDALCELASAENWCRKFPCGTCGNTDFRYGLLELSRGKSPNDKNWVVYSSQSYYDKVGKFPHNFTDKEKIAVLKICLESDLSIINEICDSQLWIGYFSLVLEFMRTKTDLYHEVSHRWATQLQKMVPEDSEAYRYYQSLAKEDGYFLSYAYSSDTDLEQLLKIKKR